MPASPDFISFLLDQLSSLTPKPVTAKAMMGGRTLYAGGIIFALVDDDLVYIKADDVSKAAFIAVGCRAFAPFADRPSYTMSYYSLPDEAVDDREELLKWARLGVEAGVRAKAKSGRQRAQQKVGKKKVAKKAIVKRARTTARRRKGK